MIVLTVDSVLLFVAFGLLISLIISIIFYNIKRLKKYACDVLLFFLFLFFLIAMAYGLGFVYKKDIGPVSGITQNMYLEGSRLYYDKDVNYYKYVQPNGISTKIDRIELKEEQNEVVKQDSSDIILLQNCVYEADFKIIKFRYFYNILYLDKDSFEKYKEHESDFVIKLDEWMEDSDLLNEDGSLK